MEKRGPPCKTCIHPQRRKVDADLIRGILQVSVIARKYGIGYHSVLRHSKTHLPQGLAKAAAKRELDSAEKILQLIEDLMRPSLLLQQACDEYLRDPSNVARYSLEPRAEDIDVIYLDTNGDGEKTVRKKARLSLLLKRIEKTVLMTSWKVADPRELVLKAAVALDKQIHTLAQVAGYLQAEAQQTNIEINLVQIMPTIYAVLQHHPTAFKAVQEAVRASYPSPS